MFFYLSKILDFLIQPLVWVFILLIIGLLKKSSKIGKRFLVAGLAVAYLFSNQVIFHEVTSSWEAEPRKVSEITEQYKVAIVLGGMVSYDSKHQLTEFQSNSDRILNVLPLYFKGQVEKILISGGSGRLAQDELEAGILKTYLISIGVDSADILIEQKSRNTYENAKYSVELLKELGIKGKILLSTSSTHMARSYLCFKKLGFEVDPFPVDQVSYKRNIDLDTLFFPKAKVLDSWYHLIHEWVGILTYKLAGYI